MKRLTYEIVIEREEDAKAGYWFTARDPPGCVSNGGTAAEAKRNIREAMGLYWKASSLMARKSPTTQNRSRGPSWPWRGMSRFPTVRATELVRFLKTHGFMLDRQRGSHVILRNPGDGPNRFGSGSHRI